MIGQARARPSTAQLASMSPPATSPVSERTRSYFTEDFGEDDDVASPLASLGRKPTQKSTYSMLSASSGHTPRTTSSGVRNTSRAIPAPDPIITISTDNNHLKVQSDSNQAGDSSTSLADDADEDLDYVTVEHPEHSDSNQIVPRDKASRVLGIRHRKSMEPIPASNRVSIASVRSAPAPEATAPTSSGPTLPLASLYVVSGLPKSPYTWTLADPDSVAGLHHSEGAVSRWWRPEVLGSTVSPGAGGSGGKKKKRGKSEDASTMLNNTGQLSKQEVGKMLSKALKVRSSSRYSSWKFIVFFLAVVFPAGS
jgi:EEF1A N-terminal glycine/lysine methyltransferase